MSSGLIDFSQIGDAAQPSPSIWGDCPRTLLQDRGLGYFRHSEFLGASTGTLAAALDVNQWSDGGGLRLASDTSLVLSQLVGGVGGFLKGVQAATDNNAFTFLSAPLGAIVLNSGNKLWFETRLQLNELSDDALFVGLTTETNGTVDVIADNPSNSAVAALTAATVLGFVTKQTASAIASIDAKYAKATATPVVVLTDVTNAVAIDSASRFTPAATTPFKLGLRFDGKKKIYFYVNGWKVASQTVDATVDQTSNLCVAINFKNGAGAAHGIAIDWVRYGFQARN